MSSRSCVSGQNEMAENSEQSTNVDLIGKSANGLVDKASEQPAVAVSEAAVERASPCPYRLFRRERSVHQIMGGGKAADVILWRRHNVTIGILFAATAAWLLFERSGYALLSLVANVLLLLIVILFLWANSAALLKRPPPPLPELELSEEIVNSAAASMRVRINYSLAVAHDIALGKDFKLFAKVVVCLWLLSVVGSWFNFLTLVYFSVVAFITIPALYDKYADQVDRFAEIAEEEIIKLSKKFDDKIGSKVAMVLSKEKKIQ